MLKVLLLVVCAITLAAGHICIVRPAQRGGVTNEALATEGADMCGKTQDPCGQMYKGYSQENYTTGREGAIVFQKNLDHFYEDDPGFFEIRIGDSDSSFYKTLATIRDSRSIHSLETLTATFIVPEEGKVLQLIYRTNNPEAPPYFYQCADITINRN